MENQQVSGAGKSIKPATPKSRSRRSEGAPYWVANVIMLVLGVIIGFVGHWLIAGGTAAPASMFDTVISKTRHFRGNANAPVTMIEFSDFQ